MAVTEKRFPLKAANADMQKAEAALKAEGTFAFWVAGDEKAWTFAPRAKVPAGDHTMQYQGRMSRGPEVFGANLNFNAMTCSATVESVE